MYVVTNRIDVKKGFAEKMAPKFTQGGKIQELQGFHKIEVWLIDDEEDYDQMYINTWWQTKEDFNGWLNSEAFKEAHAGRSNSKNEESPVLGNKVVKANILSELTN
ncbi:heme oxygenase [Staphylococcus caeli]|uniref:heme oxygenase n=1 Tax=Staphylococcus caeli TaxID=2201815 RepID=UPI003F570671